MKVLHILNSIEYSGAEMMILNSLDDFKKKNFFFYICSNSEKPGSAQKQFIKKNIEVINLNLNSIKNYLKLYDFIKKKNIDIVHIHTEANFFKLCLLSTLAKVKSVVRTIHGVFNPSFLLKLRRKIIFYYAKKIDVKLISVSDCVSKNELIYFNNKSSIIYNYFDKAKFKFVNKKQKHYAKKKLCITTKTLVISIIGNCSETKNHNLIIEAFKEIKNKKNFFFIHIGKENNNANERKLIYKNKFHKYFRFYGSILNWNILCTASDIIINSSKNEGLGNSTLEAASMGMLPILTNVQGNLTILKKIRNTISIQNSRDLSKKLNLINRNKSAFLNTKKLLKISRDVNKFFNKANYIKYYVNIYEKN